jgi:hypothetical protein
MPRSLVTTFANRNLNPLLRRGYQLGFGPSRAIGPSSCDSGVNKTGRANADWQTAGRGSFDARAV